MANSNGYITAPVSIYDVEQALGDSSTDLGTLCQSTRINKWARYKPVKCTKLFTNDELESNNTWKSTSTWWKATAGNCGIAYNTFSSVANVKTAIDNQALVWTYDPPTGGASQPFRLTDFNQYVHNAIPPVWGLYAQTAILQAGHTMEVGIAAGVSGVENITFGDFPALANYYFTVAFYNSAGTTLEMIYSAPTKIGNMVTSTDLVFEIPYATYNGKLTAGQHKMYGFLCSYQYTGQTSEVSGKTYIPLPYLNNAYGAPPIDVTAQTANQWVSIDAYVIGSGTVVNWGVYVYGAGSVQGTVRLIEAATGNVVSGQSHTVTAGTLIPSSDPHYSSQTVGYYVVSTISTGLVMPAANPEAYMVEFVAANLSGRGMIAYEAQSTT